MTACNCETLLINTVFRFKSGKSETDSGLTQDSFKTGINSTGLGKTGFFPPFPPFSHGPKNRASPPGYFWPKPR